MKYSCLTLILIITGTLFAAGNSIFLYSPTHTDTGVWLIGSNNDGEVINAGDSVGSYLPTALTSGISYFGDNEASYGPYLNLPSNPTTPMVGDIDGDGEANTILKGSDASGYDALLAAWTTRPVGSDALTYCLLNADNSAVFAADVNGDGTDDIVARGTANNNWIAYHCDPNGLAAGPDSWRGGDNAANYSFTGDFNGDGVADVGEYRTSDAMVLCWLGVSGVGLSSDANLYFWDDLKTYDAGFMGLDSVDLNGDGLDDIVEFIDQGSNWVCKIYLARSGAGTPAGHDFNGAYAWASIAKTDLTATNQQLLAADIDGDGFGDLVIYEEFIGPVGKTNGRLRVIYGDGNIANVAGYDAWQTRARQETKEYRYDMIFAEEVSGFVAMAAITDTDPANIVGDINDDGSVDPADVSDLAADWLNTAN
jgi:hypothetical protein